MLKQNAHLQCTSCSSSVCAVHHTLYMFYLECGTINISKQGYHTILATRQRIDNRGPWTEYGYNYNFSAKKSISTALNI